MIINNNVQALAGIYAANSSVGARRGSRVEQPVARDEILLSSEAQNFSDLLRELRGTSEVREDKVAAFSARTGVNIAVVIIGS